MGAVLPAREKSLIGEPACLPSQIAVLDTATATIFVRPLICCQ